MCRELAVLLPAERSRVSVGRMNELRIISLAWGFPLTRSWHRGEPSCWFRGKGAARARGVVRAHSLLGCAVAMRLTIKDRGKMNGAGVTQGGARTTSHAVISGEAHRPLLATVYRAIDGAAVEVEEAVRQILSGVVPYVPRIRVRETSEAIIVSGRLRHVDVDSVEVTLTREALKITGIRMTERERLRRTYRSVEKVFRTFERAIPFDCEVDRDRVVATLRNDMLRIHVPKKATSRAPSRSVPLAAE